ncbi:MAG: hypothetical protein HYZ12_05190 [Thaumarchaeota archaeon]|nr:hypothetical protein [Nitrososphaerota archaeon]
MAKRICLRACVKRRRRGGCGITALAITVISHKSRLRLVANLWNGRAAGMAMEEG